MKGRGQFGHLGYELPTLSPIVWHFSTKVWKQCILCLTFLQNFYFKKIFLFFFSLAVPLVYNVNPWKAGLDFQYISAKYHIFLGNSSLLIMYYRTKMSVELVFPLNDKFSSRMLLNLPEGTFCQVICQVTYARSSNMPRHYRPQMVTIAWAQAETPATQVSPAQILPHKRCPASTRSHPLSFSDYVLRPMLNFGSWLPHTDDKTEAH